MFNWFKKKEIKLCKDCVHCEPFSFKKKAMDEQLTQEQRYEMARCTALSTTYTKGNLVEGFKEISYHESCVQMRATYGGCGKKARGFKHKEEAAEPLKVWKTNLKVG